MLPLPLGFSKPLVWELEGAQDQTNLHYDLYQQLDPGVAFLRLHFGLPLVSQSLAKKPKQTKTMALLARLGLKA